MKRVSLITILMYVLYSLEGQTAREFYDMGYRLFSNHDFKGAAENFSRAIEIDPDIGEAYESRGIARYNMNDFNGAIEDLDKAVELRTVSKGNKPNPSLYSSRGLTKIALKDFQGAVEDFTLAAEQSNGTEMQHYARRANAKYFLRDYEGAVSDCNMVLNSDSGAKSIRAEAYFWRGLSKIFTGGIMDEGCQDLKKSAELGYANAGDAINRYCRQP